MQISTRSFDNVKFDKSHISAFSALALSALILMAAGGISLDQHYCQGHLKSIAFIGKASNCHEMTAGIACKHHSGTQDYTDRERSKDCCENRTALIKSDIDLFYSPMSLEDVEMYFPSVAIIGSQKPLTSGIELTTHIRDRAPPNPVRPSLYLQHESFLI